MKRLAATVACCLIVAGCGQQRYGRSYRSGMDYLAASRQEKPEGTQAFAYTHALTVEMQRSRIQQRFERTRAHCLQDTAIHCKLDTAEMSMEDDFINATLVVELPHDQISRFEKDLLAVLPEEAADDVRISSRSTQTQNVQQVQSDVSHRLSQLTDYRDRLNALAKRSNVSVEDLIKIESELSNIEGQIEQLSTQSREVGERVAREQLTMSFAERETAADALRPIGQVWRESITTLSQSAADALRFIIQIIPWLPIIAGVLYLALRLWRLARRPKT